ncbi:MAG TPA: M1 family metallopeptidase [Casimicrobiaceae bacterium]
MRRTFFAALAAVASACATSASSDAATPVPAGAEYAPPALRLPAGARPVRYELTLTVIPGEAKVQGEIAIDVELDRPHPVLWLNADEVTVARASVSTAASAVSVLPPADQFVGLAFEPPLPAGKHRLRLVFEAPQIQNATRGIFALKDRGAWYAMTQFEALSARRAFPCFDEPGFKVPWQLTLRVPRELAALSNTPVVSETDIGSGLKAVRFAETRPLPSYLIAFAVGPWQTLDLGRFGMNPTPMRIIVPRGRLADAAFVSRAYPQLFERLERWFGIAYPYAKLDQIAIPLGVGFAMENAGLITYGATGLLAKPGEATPRFRHSSAAVGAHEMSHQWVGNLVTTAWWDDIWLNEAFATWMTAKIVDEWQPRYEGGAARSAERAEAIAEDMLASARRIREPIGSRGDIFNAFDSITYQKGAAVLDMFEGWIGKEPFQRGVRRYLEERRDGNATADDFLRALGAASARPVAPAFSTFLDQNGVPQVEVALQCSAAGAQLALSQHRLAPLGSQGGTDQRWQVPVCARYRVGAKTREACTLLADESATLALGASCPKFVMANAGGRGYYVADYRGDLLAKLAANRDALSPPEYAGLLYDLRALVQAGRLSGAQALEWVRVAGNARDRHVVEAALELARFVRDTLVGEPERARFAAFVREVFGERARSLGYAPRRNESDDEELLRRSLVRFVGPEDAKLAADARRLAMAWIGDRKAVDPGMVDSVLLIAAQTGDARIFDAFSAAAKATTDPLERRNLMVALLSFGDPALARRAMGMLLDPEFDIRESMTALRLSQRSIAPRREAHAFIAANFDAMAKRVSRDAPGSWPEYAAGLCSEKDRADLEAFWRDRISRYAGGERTLKQALEQIELCARLQAAQEPAVAAFLTKR